MTTYHTGDRASLRSIPPVRGSSWCHINDVGRRRKPACYDLPRIRQMYGAISHCSYNCVPPRWNHRICPGNLLAYRQLFVYYTWWPSRTYTCTSYSTFQSSFGLFGMRRSIQIRPIRNWAERLILIPDRQLSLGIRTGLSAAMSDHYLFWCTRSTSVENELRIVWGAQV